MAMSCIHGGECCGCMDCRPESHPITCSHCGGSIYPGEGYYALEGEIWCENCIDESRREL